MEFFSKQQMLDPVEHFGVTNQSNVVFYPTSNSPKPVQAHNSFIFVVYEDPIDKTKLNSIAQVALKDNNAIAVLQTLEEIKRDINGAKIDTVRINLNSVEQERAFLNLLQNPMLFSHTVGTISPKYNITFRVFLATACEWWNV